MKMAQTSKAYLDLGKAQGQTKMAVELLDCNKQNGTSMVDDFEVLWQLAVDLMHTLEGHRIPD